MEATPCFLNQFDAISLAAMDSVRLMNRVDSKYIVKAGCMAELLLVLIPDYDVLEIGGKRLHQYQTLYFDTDKHRLYQEHHSGKTNRMKVRYRCYTDTGLCYFEVKKKNAKNRTDKHRELRAKLRENLSTMDYQLIDEVSSYAKEAFWPQLWVNFDRITLVRKGVTERVTLDLNLQISKNGKLIDMSDMVVVEIKQDKNTVRSPIVDFFKKRHISPCSFSKYAVGTALLSDVKCNRFKPIFLRMSRLCIQ